MFYFFVPSRFNLIIFTRKKWIKKRVQLRFFVRVEIVPQREIYIHAINSTMILKDPLKRLHTEAGYSKFCLKNNRPFLFRIRFSMQQKGIYWLEILKTRKFNEFQSYFYWFWSQK